uniref:Putative glycosyltransferase n=1 Tax=viral metagenome TaxID=1070528 RepID=A0A6M3J1E7_9ZZZZ
MVSILIPSRNEEFLKETVDDIFNKARGEFEVIVILDEKDQPLKPRPNLHIHKKVGKPGLRSAINQGVDIAKGPYIMKTDGHCMFSEGFDVILSKDVEDNEVIIPRRYSLIPETWEINYSRPTVDYEYVVFPYSHILFSVRTGGKWHERSEERKELLLDDEMAFQGSCWLTTKKHIESIGGYSVETSTGDEFVLESEELANKTWLSGGRCMVNKRAWYAHLHKGKRGRGYFINKWPMRRQRIFHIDYWMNDRWPQAIHKFEWLVERFWPIPGWPDDWQHPRWEHGYLEMLKSGRYPAEG